MNVKTRKKIIQTIAAIIISIFIVFFLTGCSDQKDDKQLKNKVHEEIHYIQSKIMQLLNELNGINLSNYKVSTESISGESKDSSKKDENSTSDSSSGSDMQSENIIRYKTVPNVILDNDRTPKWNNIKNDIEILEQSWSSMVLDLYKIGIPNDQIVGFSNDLNIVITNINAENKTDSLNNLAKLYSYLPEYLNHFLEDRKEVSLSYTKAYVMNAYVCIEQDNWDLMGQNMAKAEENYNNVLNQSNGKQTNYNTDKAYILLKEFQNAITMKNKDVLYIKYKNLIEELNLM